MAEIKPWDCHPDLTAERLTAVGTLIAMARNLAIEHFDESLGDNQWSLGCRAFAFCQKQLKDSAEGGESPWLTIVDPGMQFCFRIGAVPVRFYRGNADDPNERTLRQAYSELRQLSFAFGSGGGRGDLLYRFAIETDSDGDLDRIIFVGLNEHGAAECYWPVPLSDRTLGEVVEGDSRPEGVELPPPAVRLSRKAKEKSGAKE